MIDPTKPLEPAVFGTAEWWALRNRVMAPRPVTYYEEFTCTHCGTAFERRVGVTIPAKYCSPECRKRHHYQLDNARRTMLRAIRSQRRGGRSAA